LENKEKQSLVRLTPSVEVKSTFSIENKLSILATTFCLTLAARAA
jgi:hypothetical protein